MIWMNTVTDVIYDLIFPPRCPYCGEVTVGGIEACEKCMVMLECEFHSFRLENGVRCVSAFRYEDDFKNAVINYKYRGCRQYCKPFALTLSRVIEKAFPDGEKYVFTSVPTYRGIFSDRFDHVRDISRRTAANFGCEYEPLLVQRKRKQFQHSLGAEQRRANVADIYGVADEKSVEGKRILLFDDVVTTGATLSRCSQLLLDAKAAEVACVTLLW